MCQPTKSLHCLLFDVMKQRLTYIDNYRVFLIVLVITGHISVVYGGTGKGTWPYIEKVTDFFTKAALAAFDALILGFVLTSFFFVSGYFVPKALNQKGFRKFITDRLIKFSVPVIFYFFVLSNINRFLGQTARGVFNGSFFEFIQLSWSNGIYGRIGIMWFVVALLLFSIVYALFERVFYKSKWFNAPPLPSHRHTFTFVILMSAFIYISRIWFPLKGFSLSDFPLGSMVLFFLFFLLGTLAYKGNWLENINERVARPWFLVLLFVIILAFIAIATGNSGYETQQVQGYGIWHSLGFALWEVVLSVGMLLNLLLVFKNHFNSVSSFSIALSQSSFTAYTIHPTIIILVTVYMKSWVIFPFVKFLLASAIILVIVFSLSWLITRIPGVRKML